MQMVEVVEEQALEILLLLVLLKEVMVRVELVLAVEVTVVEDLWQLELYLELLLLMKVVLVVQEVEYQVQCRQQVNHLVDNIITLAVVEQELGVLNPLLLQEDKVD